ncbi:MAG: cell division ATP-binding protein FtsE [Deltaproteobacteria bacterium]|nr:cell division ATP-binding protein FtsE [Deltaproteobacteria bacterium]
MALFNFGKKRPARESGESSHRPFAFFRAGLSPQPSAANKPILVFDNVTKFHRPDQPTLRDVNLTIERGEFVFITGPSGAGKSTLIQLVHRRQNVDEGRILFCGKDIARLTSESIPYLRRNLGIVFQDFKVVSHWTVFENVAIALEILEMPRRLVRSRVAEALDRVGLKGKGDQITSTLSGGEQQRVAVARAIVTEPALVLADEPTGNLDPHLALDILTLFEEIHATGTTVLFATHDHTLLEQRPHRIVYIDDGNVKEARSGLSQWRGTPHTHAPQSHEPRPSAPSISQAARVEDAPSYSPLGAGGSPDFAPLLG